MTMTEASETSEGLHLPNIRHDQTSFSHQPVSYLAVPSHIRQKQNLDTAKAENTSTRRYNEFRGTTAPPQNKPIPTFGVGKVAPRGFPSVARRTKIFGNPSQIRRHSLPRTKSLGDCSTLQEATSSTEFNTTLLAIPIPTLYLPNDGEDGDDNASDLVTIPSSYMLPSVQGQTEVRYGSSDHGSMDERDKDTHLPKIGEYHQGRRGSSVSAFYTRQDTLQEKVEEELEKNMQILEESIEGDAEADMEGDPAADEGNDDANAIAPSNDRSSHLDKSTTIVFQPSQDGNTENVKEDYLPSVAPKRHISPTRHTLREQTGFVDPTAKDRVLLARRKMAKKEERFEKPKVEEDVFDPLAIIRASMNRMRRREAAVAASCTDKSETTVHQPLTLISLQRSHLLHARPALAMTAKKGVPRPEIDASFRPDMPDEEVGTGYLPLEKFTFVCSWLSTVEGFREQGLLDGDIVSDTELAWEFASDYTPNVGNLETHRGSI